MDSFNSYYDHNSRPLIINNFRKKLNIITLYIFDITNNSQYVCNQNSISYLFKQLYVLSSGKRGANSRVTSHITQICCDVTVDESYTGCNRRKGPDFGRVFLMLNYTENPPNTYIQSWTVWEIMASEVWNFDSCYILTDYQIRIETCRNMWFL